MSIFILHKHNGEYQGWNELSQEDFKTWQKDGSIDEGDLIVYPRKVCIATKTVVERVRMLPRNQNNRGGLNKEWKN